MGFLSNFKKELEIAKRNKAANINGKHDFEIAVDILASGKHPYKEIVTHEYSLEDIQEGFKTAYDKTSGSIKVHIRQ